MRQGKHVDEKGTIRYYKDDKLHRDDDLPAEIYSFGLSFWYQNGLIHRDGDKPAVEDVNGTKEWVKNGVGCRDSDLPAIIDYKGTREWLQNSKLHRLAGPAKIYLSGEEHYYIDDKRLTKKEHANHPEVKKYKLQQILDRVLNEPDIKTMHTQEEQI